MLDVSSIELPSRLGTLKDRDNDFFYFPYLRAVPKDPGSVDVSTGPTINRIEKKTSS